MTNHESTFLFSSPPTDVDAVHDFLHEIWVLHPDIDEMDRMAFETALIELASNVIQHADRGDGVTCAMSVSADSHELRAQFSDTAEAGGFRLRTATIPDELAESGRGLAFMQMLVDEVRYERVEDRNVWSLIKKRAASEASAD
ncbi:MAG: ATP-binding protein [Mycetocola sp.]